MNSLSFDQTVRIYVETSVISAYEFGGGDALKTTRRFFDTCAKRHHELYSSDITLREIDRANISTQAKLNGVIERFGIRLYTFNEKADELTNEYLEKNVIPLKVRADAEHIAVCSVYGVGVLTSWNLRHIVNLRTKMMVRNINAGKGYITPDILRPDEVFDTD